MLSVIVLHDIKLNVIMLSVVDQLFKYSRQASDLD